jgi:Na+-transporting NADH:ubiquinone oxidoreductase subunit NqrD
MGKFARLRNVMKYGKYNLPILKICIATFVTIRDCPLSFDVVQECLLTMISSVRSYVISRIRNWRRLSYRLLVRKFLVATSCIACHVFSFEHFWVCAMYIHHLCNLISKKIKFNKAAVSLLPVACLPAVLYNSVDVCF